MELLATMQRLLFGLNSRCILQRGAVDGSALQVHSPGMTVKKKARATRKTIRKTITTTVTREVVTWTAWCEWCGKEIHGKRKGTRFCSGTCRVNAHRDKKRRVGG